MYIEKNSLSKLFSKKIKYISDILFNINLSIISIIFIILGQFLKMYKMLMD